MIVPVFPGPLLDRTLLYTAVTRPVDQVVLVGNRAAFEPAVVAPQRPYAEKPVSGCLLAAKLSVGVSPLRGHRSCAEYRQDLRRRHAGEADRKGKPAEISANDGEAAAL